MNNPQLELDRLKSKVRVFIERLYESGYGKSSEKALPAELDDLAIIVGHTKKPHIEGLTIASPYTPSDIDDIIENLEHDNDAVCWDAAHLLNLAKEHFRYVPMKQS